MALTPERKRLLQETMAPLPGFTTISSPDLKGKSGEVFTTPVSAPALSSRMRLELSAQVPEGVAWVVRAYPMGERRELAVWRFVGPTAGAWMDELPERSVVLRLELPIAPTERFVFSVKGAVSNVDRMDPQGIIGTNDMEPYSGTSDPAVVSWGAPVARITFMVDGTEYSCTGFMVTADLLLTNNHCLAADDELPSAVFEFRYERAGSPGDRYRATKVEQTDYTLDYSVLRLKGRPGAKHGTLTLKGRPALSAALVVIHHPRGQPKMITRNNCAASRLGVSGNGEELTDFLHLCDTQRGSSGAPIIHIGGRVVVGLHHLGCEDAHCNEQSQLVNRGVEAGAILQHIQSANPALAAELGCTAPELRP